MQTETVKPPESRKREEHSSSDGKWRSFPKVPHLLQYGISGNYFGKVKIDGKRSAKVWRQASGLSYETVRDLRKEKFLKNLPASVLDGLEEKAEES